MNQLCLRNNWLRFRVFKKNTSYRWIGCVREISSWGLGSSGKILVIVEPDVFEENIRVSRKNTSYKWMGWVWEISGRGLRLQKINHHKWTGQDWEITSWRSWLHKITNHSEEIQKLVKKNNEWWVAVFLGSAFASWTKATFHSQMQMQI
jgi:hypothetical protein